MENSIIYIKRFQNRAKQVNYKKLTDTLNKKNILIKLYSKQRVLAELKTSLAVENCQELMLAEIENLFKVKYIEVSHLINKLSTSKVCGMYDCSSLIVSTDINELTSIMEEILQKELEKRFSFSRNTSLELDYQPKQLFNLVEDWRRTKNRSLFITRQIEKCSKNFLHNAVKINFQNESLLHITKKSKLSSSLLKSLGIDAGKQQAELFVELRNRLEGSIDSIKSRMIIDIKEKVAQVYYQIHDAVIDRAILEKIALLEKGLAEEESRFLERREA